VLVEAISLDSDKSNFGDSDSDDGNRAVGACIGPVTPTGIIVVIGNRIFAWASDRSVGRGSP